MVVVLRVLLLTKCNMRRESRERGLLGSRLCAVVVVVMMVMSRLL